MAQKTIFELDLVQIARARKHLSIATTFMFIAIVSWLIWIANSGPQGNQVDIFFMGIQIGLGVLGIWVVVASVLLQISMKTGILMIVLTAIVALALPWLIGIALISQATTILKLAGAKPGFFGMSQSEKDKITPGHCRGCGYDRAGIGLLDPCPECTRVPQVI